MAFRRGFTLITALAMMIAIGLGASTLLRSMGNTAVLKSNMVAEIQSQYIAEAGVHYAAWLCRTAGGVCPASTAYTIDGKPVTITATTLTPTYFYNITVANTYSDL